MMPFSTLVLSVFAVCTSAASMTYTCSGWEGGGQLLENLEISVNFATVREKSDN